MLPRLGLRVTSKVVLVYSPLCRDLLTIVDFIIPDAEFEALNKLDRNTRYNYPFRWGIDIFGELGPEEAERRAEEFAAKLRAEEA